LLNFPFEGGEDCFDCFGLHVWQHHPTLGQPRLDLTGLDADAAGQVGDGHSAGEHLPAEWGVGGAVEDSEGEVALGAAPLPERDGFSGR
jgi:hypothetical protein